LYTNIKTYKVGKTMILTIVGLVLIICGLLMYLLADNIKKYISWQIGLIINLTLIILGYIIIGFTILTK
jgi:hypothetical protein